MLIYVRGKVDRIHAHPSLLIAFFATTSFSLLQPAVLRADTPAAFLEYSTLAGVGNALKISRLPVRNGNGTITYKDVSMSFVVDATGRLTLNTSSVSITSSPAIAVGEFRPGTYSGARIVSDITYVVGTPGVGAGGRISGSIQKWHGTNSDWFNASWTSGPIAGHPYEAMLKDAGIVSGAFNWGVMGTAGSFTQNMGWHAGDIIGVIQAGDTLSMTNFGNDNKPDATLSFALCPTSSPC